MLDSIGQSAVRSLGVDVANLTSRLAVSQAVLNEIIAIGNSFDMSQWQHNPVPSDNGAPSGAYITTLPGTEADKLQRLMLMLQEIQGPAAEMG